MPSLKARIKKLAYQKIISDKDRDRIINALDVAEQESKTDTWSIKEVADVLEKHGLLEQESKTDIFDEIRAEIKFEVDRRTNMLCAEDVFEIIDKYRK